MGSPLVAGNGLTNSEGLLCSALQNGYGRILMFPRIDGETSSLKPRSKLFPKKQFFISVARPSTGCLSTEVLPYLTEASSAKAYLGGDVGLLKEAGLQRHKHFSVGHEILPHFIYAQSCSPGHEDAKTSHEPLPDKPAAGPWDRSQLNRELGLSPRHQR